MSEDLIQFLGSAESCCVHSTAANENGRQFIIDTREVFTKVKIDPCLISSNDDIKCDYMFIRHTNEDFYFVELKGTDIQHAVNQIKNTKRILIDSYIDIPKNNCFGFVVCTRVPHNINISNLKQFFKKYVGKELQVSSGSKLVYKLK